MNRRVSIVIPIYNARALTERCIASVREHARGDWRLILVNDRSTDEGLNAGLRSLPAQDPRILLVENPVNRGFVATANTGMRAAGEDDVLLLNSDTEVFEGFLERLAAAAYTDDCTGVVSPFSNNATLCSIPIPFRDNPIPSGFTPAELNRLVAFCSMRERPEIPTAVGFCMFIRNAVFRDAGFFDEDRYGRGFGEENDFCELAKEAGWKIRLADDVFVYHKGKASFGDEGRELERRNLAILEERHPGYLRRIEKFIAEQPLHALHDRIRLQLRRDRGARNAAMLFLLHASPYAETPGGTEFHVRDLVRHLRLPRAVIAYPQGEWLVAAEVIDGAVDSPLLYRFALRSRPRRFLLEDPDVERLLARLLRLFNVAAAHVHHLMYWPIAIGRVFHDAGIPCVHTLHDYFAVCPNWNLFDAGSGHPCPCDDSASCERSCLPLFFEKDESHKPGSGLSFISLRNRHRAAFADALRAASVLVFPSSTARDEVRRFHQLDADICTVIEHGYAAPQAGAARPESGPVPPRLRLLVLGEVAEPIKGAANYLELIRLTRDMAVEWHFIGRTPQQHFEHKLAEQSVLDRVTFHGRIDRAQLFERIVAISPDVGVLLPACRETFSYVLSEFVLAGLPVLVNELGAPAERTRNLGIGWVASSLEEAAETVRELTQRRDLLRDVAKRVRATHHVTLEENAEAHRTVYARSGVLSRLDRLVVTAPIDLAALAASWTESTDKPTRKQAMETHVAVVDPTYQKAQWYRTFLKVKPLIPGSLRRAGRDVLLRYQYKTWRVLHPNRDGEVNGLRLLKRGVNEATWAIDDANARITFDVGPVPTRSVRLIRFRLLRQNQNEAFAQIFWTHSPDEGFDANRSVRVSLDSRTGEWREYLLRLDAPQVAQAWRAGENVYGLRFDPSNVPGIISLGPIELGG